jgi:hypothetical protein
MSILRRLVSPTTSLYDLASARKRLKAREKDIIHLPEVISMQSDIEPSVLPEITETSSKERHHDLLRRYGVDWIESQTDKEPKQFCIYCHAPEDTDSKCTYSLPHKFASLDKAIVPVEELCIRCGLHPRNPAATVNGCNHRQRRIQTAIEKREAPEVHNQPIQHALMPRIPGYVGVLKCNVCEFFRRAVIGGDIPLGKDFQASAYSIATCWACEPKTKGFKVSTNPDLDELKTNPQEPKTEAKTEAKTEDKKPEEKKEEPKPKKMKRWPEGQMTLQAKDVIAPIKEVLEKGYRLIRKDVKEVEYGGFNIGKHELSVMPNPKVRFTKDYLEYEQKCGNTLFDVALNVLFLLGVEQGRRTERHFNRHLDKMLATLKSYRNTNKDLRNRVDELESYIEIKNTNPKLTDKELRPLVERMVKEKRPKRLAALQAELEADPSAVGSIRHPHKAHFANVLGVSNVISADTTKEQWIAYLNECGWSYEEWKRVCKKRKVKQLKFRKPKN